MHQEPHIAPAPILVHYLAILHRFLVATEDATRRGDKAEILLCGHLANALHNVPAMLWNYTADSWYTPAGMAEMLQAFPEGMRSKGAPERLVATSQVILSAEDDPAELGLQADLSDLDLAPIAVMHDYLDRLHMGCVALRSIRRIAPNTPEEWQNIEPLWTERADELSQANGRLARILDPFPAALTCWGIRRSGVSNASSGQEIMT